MRVAGPARADTDVGGRSTADTNLLPRDAALQHETLAPCQRVHSNIVVELAEHSCDGGVRLAVRGRLLGLLGLFVRGCLLGLQARHVGSPGTDFAPRALAIGAMVLNILVARGRAR